MNKKLQVCYSSQGLNNEQFNNRTGLDHLNTKLFHYSDQHCVSFKNDQGIFLVIVDHGGAHQCSDLPHCSQSPDVHRVSWWNCQMLGHWIWGQHPRVQGTQALGYLHEVWARSMYVQTILVLVLVWNVLFNKVSNCFPKQAVWIFYAVQLSFDYRTSNCRKHLITELLKQWGSKIQTFLL